MLHKEAEQLVLCAGQFQQDSVFVCLPLQQPDGDAARFQYGFSCAGRICTAKQCIDPRQQYSSPPSSSPMMIFISSSEAVRNRIGTLDVRRTFWQKSKPEPSGRETSSTSRSYFLSDHSTSASASVRAVSSAKPCFLNAKVSPLIFQKEQFSHDSLSFLRFVCPTGSKAL